jgi:hypothetical protein
MLAAFEWHQEWPMLHHSAECTELEIGMNIHCRSGIQTIRESQSEQGGRHSFDSGARYTTILVTRCSDV